MKYILVVCLMFLSSCFTSRPSNAIDSLAEEVIKKKEGVDIRMTPVEEEKHGNH